MYLTFWWLMFLTYTFGFYFNGCHVVVKFVPYGGMNTSYREWNTHFKEFSTIRPQVSRKKSAFNVESKPTLANGTIHAATYMI